MNKEKIKQIVEDAVWAVNKDLAIERVYVAVDAYVKDKAEAIEEAFSLGRAAGNYEAAKPEECPFQLHSLGANWWTRGFSYSARMLRAIEAEQKLKALEDAAIFAPLPEEVEALVARFQSLLYRDGAFAGEAGVEAVARLVLADKKAAVDRLQDALNDQREIWRNTNNELERVNQRVETLESDRAARIKAVEEAAGKANELIEKISYSRNELLAAVDAIVQAARGEK